MIIPHLTSLRLRQLVWNLGDHTRLKLNRVEQVQLKFRNGQCNFKLKSSNIQQRIHEFKSKQRLHTGEKEKLANLFGYQN